MNLNSKFWKTLQVVWDFIEDGFCFLNNKKTKIGIALSLAASYWLGVDQIASNADSWRDAIPTLLAYTSTYVSGGAAAHCKYKEIQAKKPEGKEA